MHAIVNRNKHSASGLQTCLPSSGNERQQVRKARTNNPASFMSTSRHRKQEKTDGRYKMERILTAKCFRL